MRTFLTGLMSLALVLMAHSASAQNRVCAGSCDRFGNPIDERFLDEEPRYYDERRHRRARSSGSIRLSLGYDSHRSSRRYVQPSHSEFYPRNRRYGSSHHTQRRYQRRAYHAPRRTYRRSHRTQYRHTQYRHERRHVGRTKFCRIESRRSANGWGKTKVRRCVLVRNDLLGNRHLRRSYNSW